MKKTISIMLTVLLVLGLFAGCGSKDTPATEAATTPATEAAVVTEAATEASPTLKTVEEGKLIMGTNAAFPPYEFLEGSQVVGIDADIAAAVAEKLGLELVIQDMEFASLVESVKSGKIDIALAGMTVTPERAEIIDFTTSYATGVQVIIVTEDSPITSIDDLSAEGANYVFGVQSATTGDLYSTWDFEDAGMGTVERYSKGADAVQALLTGKVDCVMIDNEPAKEFVAANEGLKILDTEYITEDYAAAMSKDNPELYAAVNTAIEELIADGTIAAIIGKYIVAE